MLRRALLHALAGRGKMRYGMKKRALRSMSMVVSLAALLLATGVHAAPATVARAAAVDPVIRFSPSSTTVDPAATFVLDVVVDNVVDLGGFEFTVSFNPAVVQVQGVTPGSFLGSTGRTATPLGPNIDAFRRVRPRKACEPGSTPSPR